MATKKPQHSGSPTARARRSQKSLADLIQEFLIAHKSEGHSPKTLEWHQTSVGYFVRYLEQKGMTDPKELETSHLRSWVVWLGEPESSVINRGRSEIIQRSKRTINTYARSVHAFCKWLFEEGHTQEDVIPNPVIY